MVGVGVAGAGRKRGDELEAAVQQSNAADRLRRQLIANVSASR